MSRNNFEGTIVRAFSIPYFLMYLLFIYRLNNINDEFIELAQTAATTKL